MATLTIELDDDLARHVEESARREQISVSDWVKERVKPEADRATRLAAIEARAADSTKLALVTGQGLQLWDLESGTLRAVPGGERVRDIASAKRAAVWVTVSDDAVTVWDSQRIESKFDLWNRDDVNAEVLVIAAGSIAWATAWRYFRRSWKREQLEIAN